MTAFEDLAALPDAEIYVAVDLQAVDPATGDVLEFNVTTAPRLHTEPGDVPPSRTYHSAMVEGWRSTRSLTDARSFGGRSSPRSITMVLDNSPTSSRIFTGEPDSGGLFDGWQDLDWQGQPMTVKLGGRIRADGTAYPYAEYQTYFTGTVAELESNAKGQIVVTVEGPKGATRDKVVSETYGGFGGAGTLVAPNAAQTLTVAALGLGTMCIEWIGVVRSLPVTEGALVRHGGSTASPGRIDYGIAIDSGGRLGVYYNDGVNRTAWSESYTVTAGDALSSAVNYDAASGTIELYAGRRGSDTRKVLAVKNSGHLGSADGRIIVGQRIFSVAGVDIDMWEIRVWSSPRTKTQISAGIHATLYDAAGELDLIEAWKFSEGFGVNTAGLKGVTALGSGFLGWASSREGNDPEQFGGALMGQTKPDGWGRAYNVPLVLIDSQRDLHQWSRSPSTDILRLRVDGAPLAPAETLTAAGAGEISWDGTTQTVVLTVPSGLSAHRFVPGQAKPLIYGQLVEISNAPGYDGTYRVAVDGVSADGLRMDLVDEFGAPVALGSAALPAGTVVATPAAGIGYTYDLATSTVTTTVTGQLTADVVMRLGATPTVSDVIEDVTGITPESVLTFDPIVGGAVITGKSPDVGALLDELMASCLGWWEETDTGGYRIGNFEVPAGTPVAALIGSRTGDLVGTYDLPAVIGSIKSIKPAKAVIPAWQVIAEHSVGWHVHQPGTVKLAVAQDIRQRLETGALTETRTNAETKERWPTSSTEPKVLRTWLNSRADALELLRRANGLLMSRRRWFDLDVGGLGLLALSLGDVVLVEHPHPTHGLLVPTLAVVRSISTPSTSSDLTTVGVYL